MLENKVHSRNLLRWAESHPEGLVLSGDLTSSTEILEFSQKYPDRFYSMGLTEQNTVSWAAGMAREGFIPMFHTFAVFMYRRALDQIAISVAYPNLPVRFYGFLPGLTTPGGVTHQAIEDAAVMRALPNMTVIDTGDATDVESVLDVCDGIQGPVYVRMLRGEMPRLFPSDCPLVLDRARVLSNEGTLTVLSSGVCTEEAMKVCGLLASRGFPFRLLHVSTLKPFTDPAVVEAVAAGTSGVITIENHSTIGGLGSAVAEVMAEHGIGNRLVRLGIPDTFLHGSSRNYLMREVGIDAAGLLAAIEALCGSSFNISPEEIAAQPALFGNEAEAL